MSEQIELPDDLSDVVPGRYELILELAAEREVEPITRMVDVAPSAGSSG